LLIEIRKDLAWITINRPEKLNAINREVMKDLLSALDEIEEETGVRVLLITGSGDRAFSTGADVSDFLELDREEIYRFAELGQKVFDRIESSEKPSIAVINGYALGGGMELALSCDIRVASERAKLGFPEVNLGLIPGWGGIRRAARLIGVSKSKYLAMTGELLDSKRAEELGLVDLVVPHQELKRRAEEIAKTLSGKSSKALRAIKKITRLGSFMDIVGPDLEKEFLADLSQTDEAKSLISAFLEKRGKS